MKHVLSMTVDIDPELADEIAGAADVQVRLTYDIGDAMFSSVRVSVLPEGLATLPRGTLIVVTQVRNEADMWGSRRDGRWVGVLDGSDSVLLIPTHSTEPEERFALKHILKWSSGS